MLPQEHFLTIVVRDPVDELRDQEIHPALTQHDHRRVPRARAVRDGLITSRDEGAEARQVWGRFDLRGIFGT